MISVFSSILYMYNCVLILHLIVSHYFVIQWYTKDDVVIIIRQGKRERERESNKLYFWDFASDEPLLKWVIDITIGYPENSPLDIFQVLSGRRPSCTTVLYYRKYPISEVPTDEEQLLKWMYKRFEEKENLLETFYTRGEFVINPSYHSASSSGKLITKPRMVKMDVVKIWMLHSLFLLSSYFHCCLLSIGWHWLMGQWTVNCMQLSGVVRGNRHFNS